MVGRVFFDGLNLSLAQGTGVATYTRMLAQVVSDLGGEVGVIYASAQRPPKDPLLREVAFFGEKREVGRVPGLLAVVGGSSVTSRCRRRPRPRLCPHCHKVDRVERPCSRPSPERTPPIAERLA
jgi:hypothetical protein